MVASAGVLTDRGDIAVEQYERLDMHTLKLGVCKWGRNCRSLVCTFARFNCLRKKRSAATFIHIISTCTLHFKSFYIITPGNLADGTTSMFVLLIVIGSKGFSDFVNDILSFLHFDSFNWKPSARDFVTHSSTRDCIELVPFFSTHSASALSSYAPRD